MASVENVATADGVSAAADAAKAAQVLPEAGAVEEADAEARGREASKLVSADKRILAMVNLVRGAVAPLVPQLRSVRSKVVLLTFFRQTQPCNFPRLPTARLYSASLAA